MSNIMTPMTKILILIATMIAINGDAVADTDRPDTSDDKLSETLTRLKLDVADYSGIDLWSMWLLRNRLIEPPQTSPPTETTTTNSNGVGYHGCRRKRRQALVNMRGEDGGSTSVVSVASSSSPLNVNGEDINPLVTKLGVKEWLLQQLEIDMMNRIRESGSRNRSRRSATDAKISSDNTTPSAGTMFSDSEHNMSAVKCLLSLTFPVSLPTKCIQFYFRSLSKAIH